MQQVFEGLVNTQNTIYYTILIVGAGITNKLVEAVLKLSNRILPNNTGSFTNDKIFKNINDNC